MKTKRFCIICKKTYLEYEQIRGIRIKKENPINNKYEYHAYCPFCKKYYWLNK